MKNKNQAITQMIESLKDTHKGTWQFLEVKQMGDILARHREKARLAIREYRLLKNARIAETDPIEKVYLGYEGLFMRDHLRDTLRLYMMVNHDYHEAYEAYMTEINKPAEMVVPIPSELLSDKAKRGKRAA